jgi:hypothetical protein
MFTPHRNFEKISGAGVGKFFKVLDFCLPASGGLRKKAEV